MTELRSGENRPWPDARVTAYVAGAQVGALLLGPDGRALSTAAWVDAATPARGAVAHVAGSVQGVTALLADVDPAVARVLVVATGFDGAPTAQVLTSDGAVAFTVTPAALSTETALVMVEVYRRDGAWKVRALAQGYAGGLAALAAAYGAATPTSAPASAAPAAPSPVLDDPVRQIGMILDDASRTTASFESSQAFAEQRLERDLEQLVGDPSLRVGPAAEAARAAAQQRRDQLVVEARARHRTDLAQLGDELATLARVLPPSLAPWTAPGWQVPRPDAAPAAWAVRLGELALPSAPDFRLPMVRTLPLAPALWIETEDGGEVVAARMMAALTTRLVVGLPRAPRLAVVDVGDRAMLGHLPTSEPPATDPGEASRVLQEHVEHLRMVAMARRSQALDDLPPQHRPGRVLLVPDFPGGLDDSSVAAVHQLVAHGADCGVNVVLSGRRPESLGIAVLDLVHDLCLRVPTAPGGDLVDSYGGVSWVFHPDLGPDDPFVAERVQDAVTRRVTERDRT
ncbi:TerD family protein [Nocardioides rubriscoriae]|uniref:TerD family protein n=1 Tax=Nocardioides rubriscoriae TaxID=642762 RepID=UPI0011E0382F|nr:TerD family protein [Nocardioides rubriscoriae]